MPLLSCFQPASATLTAQCRAPSATRSRGAASARRTCRASAATSASQVSPSWPMPTPWAAAVSTPRGSPSFPPTSSLGILGGSERAVLPSQLWFGVSETKPYLQKLIKLLARAAACLRYTFGHKQRESKAQGSWGAMSPCRAPPWVWEAAGMLQAMPCGRAGLCAAEGSHGSAPTCRAALGTRRMLGLLSLSARLGRAPRC